MRLYNAMATGTLEDTETVLLQLVLPSAGLSRAKVVSWSASFNGMIAGNSLSFRIVRDSSAGTASESGSPAVLDGSFFAAAAGDDPTTSWGFTSNPTVGSVIEGPLQAPDSSHVFRQYGSGKELILDNDTRTSLRCTPSDMVAVVGYKVNFIFWA